MEPHVSSTVLAASQIPRMDGTTRRLTTYACSTLTNRLRGGSPQRLRTTTQTWQLITLQSLKGAHGEAGIS